jgi:hypothetical protein
VPRDYPGKSVTLALIDEHEGVSRCVGSAVAVAPGLALTASHIVDDCVRHSERNIGQSPRPLSLTGIQSFDDKAVVWAVDFIYGSVLSDIAFLRFARPNWWGDGPGQLKPAFARLNLNPPAVGDEVRVFGFPNSKLHDGTLNIFPAECACRVRKVEVRTDEPKWYKPLAHIELDGQIEHGMSGGPCFDKDWNVIGINSSGWSGPRLATVALLWPAMKIQIDLFQTGLFPAIDLFKSGETAALGYKRVYVTSKGDARFARVDPTSLRPLGYLGATESLSGAIDHAGAGAENCLAEVCEYLTKAQQGGEPINSNRIISFARYFFWELEAAIRLSVLLAARQLKLTVPEPLDWAQLVEGWKAQKPTGEILDQIAKLEFDWNGEDLFDGRTYAELSRSGVLGIEYTSNAQGLVLAASLEPPCRAGCPQLFLPDGLDRFINATRRFVHRLLLVSNSANIVGKSATDETVHSVIEENEPDSGKDR